MQAVVGVDVGGTTTRVGVARPDGGVLAALDGPGANPNTVGPEVTAGRIRELVGAALDRSAQAATDVVAVTIGMAGGTRVLATADLLAAFRRAAAPAGLGAVPEVVLDVAAAFSAGSPADRGRVLVAGTGSIAALVERGRVSRRAGGWGWLLGDEGSGFWLGREAVRHVLAGSESGRSVPAGPLVTGVLQAYGVTQVDDLLPAVYAAGEAGPGGAARPSQRLAALSVTVADLVDTDPAAALLVDRAADRLVALVGELGGPADGGKPADGGGPADGGERPADPLVLAGSLLTSPGPVARRVRERLVAAGGQVVTAGPAVVGPLWLAIRALGRADDTVHRRLGAELHRWKVDH